jgi:hypothetical protein
MGMTAFSSALRLEARAVGIEGVKLHVERRIKSRGVKYDAALRVLNKRGI